MGKGNGTTRASSSGNPNGLSNNNMGRATQAIDKFSNGVMPALSLSAKDGIITPKFNGNTFYEETITLSDNASLILKQKQNGGDLNLSYEIRIKGQEPVGDWYNYSPLQPKRAQNIVKEIEATILRELNRAK